MNAAKWEAQQKDICEKMVPVELPTISMKKSVEKWRLKHSNTESNIDDGNTTTKDPAAWNNLFMYPKERDISEFSSDEEPMAKV